MTLGKFSGGNVASSNKEDDDNNNPVKFVVVMSFISVHLCILNPDLFIIKKEKKKSF